MKIEVRKPTEEEKGMAQDWPLWKKDVSEFEWSYDGKETCFIIRGRAEVEGDDGDRVVFGAGDWVVFPAGLKCTWRIMEDLEKRYRFGD